MFNGFVEISEKEHHIDSKTLRELKFQMTLPKPTLYDEGDLYNETRYV